MEDLDLGNTLRGFAANQKVLGRYTLTRILGRGGMGVVWLARDDELERDVALKFLPEVVAMDKQSIAELKRETRRSLELTHPHIIRIYDFVQDARTAAIAMEYIDGETLAARKVDRPAGRLEVAEIREWVRQALEALAYAHTRALVVHRDLKPANLMIDARGELKVADFGIAASMSESVSRVSVQAGSSGTPVYMSPQQMMGERPAVTDDIYAFGATLYDLLTGKPPFYSGNIIAQVQAKVPLPVGQRRRELDEANGAPGAEAGEIPAEWETAIAACLAKEPKDRPQSAADLARRLGLNASPALPVVEESKTREPARPGADSLASTPGGPPRPQRRRSIIAGMAVAVVALAAAAYYFGVAMPAGRRQADESAQPAAPHQLEPFMKWAAQLPSDTLLMTPLDYSAAELDVIFQGLARGLADRVEHGEARWLSTKGMPGQPLPADVFAQIGRRRDAIAKGEKISMPPEILEFIGWWIAHEQFFPDFEFTEPEWKAFLDGVGRRLTGRPLPEIDEATMERFEAELEPRKERHAARMRAARMAAHFKFLDTQKDILRTASGLRYRIAKEGAGERAGPNSRVRCRFATRSLDGEFLGLESMTEPVELKPGDVMDGMWEGVQLVRAGGSIELYIPAGLTQGGRLEKYPGRDYGFQRGIDLKVEIDVLEVSDG